MREKYFRYLLLIFLLAPLVSIVFFTKIDGGFLLPIFLILGIPIVGHLFKQVWAFYYIYVEVGFILFSFIFMSAYTFIFLAQKDGVAFLVSIVLYFICVLVLTILLHKENIKNRRIRLAK